MKKSREIKVDIKWLDENGNHVPPGIARLEKFPGWKRFVDFVAEQMAEKEWKLFLEGKDNIISQSMIADESKDPALKTTKHRNKNASKTNKKRP